MSLKLIPPEEMPPLAWAALEADLDGPTIRRVAGLQNPFGYETDQLRPRFMAEAGLRELAPDEAWLRLGRQLAREVLARGGNPTKYLAEFQRIWAQSNHNSSLLELGTLDDKWCQTGDLRNVLNVLREAAAPEF